MAFYDKYNNQDNFVSGFTKDPRQDFGVYAKGYTLAANRLTNFLLETPHFSDYEAYPIVFLYRHALELSLKHIIYRSVKLSILNYNEDIDEKLKNTHDLICLSEMVEKLLVALFPKEEWVSDFVSRVSTICIEFTHLDPKSDAYRYPIDRNGYSSTVQHRTVNLRALGESMCLVLEDLSNIHFGLDMEISNAQEVYDVISRLTNDK